MMMTKLLRPRSFGNLCCGCSSNADTRDSSSLNPPTEKLLRVFLFFFVVVLKPPLVVGNLCQGFLPNR